MVFKNILLIFQGTAMGKCELRNFHMHAMFRNSPESWSTYIKGLYRSFLLCQCRNC